MFEELGNTKKIDIIIYPEFKSFEAIGPMTVFTYANKILQASGSLDRYHLTLRSTTIGPVISDTEISFQATESLDSIEASNSVLLVGAHDIQRLVYENTELKQWITNNAQKVDRFAALCSGAFFLAATGLLDGRRATTHWRMAGEFQSSFPHVIMDIDSIFIRDGNLWTSAGVSASIDLALAFVEEDHGHKLALEVAQDLVIFLKRPGGQSQFSTNLMTQKTQLSSLRQTQEWVFENLEKKINVSMMADRASMSTRHFTRLFQKEVGMCPSEFLEKSRIDFARRLLSGGDLPLKTIAFKAGFTSSDHMRLTFKKHLSVTPKEYRSRFVKSHG
ncbi:MULTISPECIES: GlxA family transcriptional regulator [Pseudomonas]|uniref:GlxA family transcriptional regulator n=1 Tax=Pseudomonas TaxID=286 RepID=UPI00062B00B1|nr:MULTISPECIES: GlxA family transcriptional regulator [Pseudomonas]KKX58009.1 AraC family transcriptional regulator [Pseudomonas putida]QFG33869.1 GlxA family transcriptional regulator [Pseudomonas umsongensis]